MRAVKPDFLFLLRYYKMKYKLPLLFLLGFVIIGLVVNSCKKDTDGSIQNLFAGGQWQLASLQVTHFVGDTLKKTDTLNTACNLDQVFTFSTDNTCTYANYSCAPQPTATGNWSLSADRLYLNSNIVCKMDTGKISSLMPFKTARIVNLGQYSLVLETGSLETYYPSNRKRDITRYGFVRQKKP
jgi:hypothetical protein